jgi:hypothetical protein
MSEHALRPVKALEELDRAGVVVAKGAIFAPRDAAEREALGAKVREASVMECQIAGLQWPPPESAPAAPEPEPQPEPEV